MNSMSAPLSLIIFTDVHYLAENLYDEGEAFQKIIDTNVGKYTEGSQVIMREMTEAVIREKPDAVLICGDLTFNGEKESLIEFSGYLKEMKDEGIPVFVICGNHDIEHRHTACYRGDKVLPAEKTSAEDFMKIMGPYGYDAAFARDASSCSYAAVLRDDIWLLCLDANVPSARGFLAPDTMAFAEDVLKRAETEGRTVITMTHQNVLKQNELMYHGFVLNNHDEVETLLKKYGVSVNFSGHTHLQHISRSEGLTDICCQCLTLWPLSYLNVRLDPQKGTFSFEKKILPVLQAESRQRFDETVVRMIAPQLEGRQIPERDREEMLQLAAEVIVPYFSGLESDREKYRNSSGWKLWHRYAMDAFWFFYLKQILEP